MVKDEIREIAEIVGGDSTYQHFVRRINKEFEISNEERNSHVYVLFEPDGNDNKIGFAVIGHSPAKMKVWNQVFMEEGWVDNTFQMGDNPFELMYMYIKPEYRNQKKGTILFKKVVQFSKDKGVNEIYAYVSDRNSTALSFYKKMQAETLQDLSDEGIVSAFLRWKL
ncbi:hypothetical protein A2W13_02560 [Candidatus Woesebacteria bacterium RBG_16_36_11]|uniref:N-acetyltransferase domain-containing protein n=1 Tax=Candidatus Woesebacteria bacterium RBG_16_36_11 TaxID=1802481 RepID=A0A1F7X9J1_9BACT|nr:MAG: hypothetical protein A2W13_02560 [Candidatus Woesebacteria bacterium RBG_16_36_11]